MSSSDNDYPPVEPGVSFIVAWQLRGKNVLVFGGNEVAAGRVYSSLEASAKVTVITPHLTSLELQSRLRNSEISWISRSYQPSDLDSADLVFTSLDSLEESEIIYSECKRLKIPVNVADVPPMCDFYCMSIHRDQSLQIAVSTNGKAPRLANQLRRQIVNAIPASSGRAIEIVGKFREKIKEIDASPQSGGKRMKWMIALCDSWGIKRLANMTDEEETILLNDFKEGRKPTSWEMAQYLIQGLSLEELEKRQKRNGTAEPTEVNSSCVIS
ncbi:putative NAD(P)-binding-domain-containing protein [Paraphysoderma sedebokerense]|nr:putative NAD(P)-binding-domain-containing protein [Paraphysoderma sedebokerense]